MPVLAAVAAVAAILAWMLPGTGTRRHTAAPPAIRTATTAPPATPSPAPTTVAADPIAAVTAAVPTSFVMQGPAFTTEASVCAMPYVRPLDPPGEQHHTVCWVQHPFGVEPGYPSTGTSYLLGHAWAHDRDEVLNPMSELAMSQVDLAAPSYEGGVPIFPVTALDGYTVTLTTATGRLTYRVTRAFAVSKARAGDVTSVMADTTPDRVVIITCGVRDTGGVLTDVEVNVIAYATLVASVPA
ncbi:MAG: hypothetical protein EPN43_09605 [Jatrophihabitans sp.]|nr:MAG: hypothetical protein EPN43_09605 [Jatrophihabitans sp.]